MSVKQISPYVFWGSIGGVGLLLGSLGIDSLTHPFFSEPEIFSGSLMGLGGILTLISLSGFVAMAIYNCKNSEGRTRLHYIVDKRRKGSQKDGTNQSTIRKLYRLRLIPNVDVRDRQGNTLFYCAYTGPEHLLAYDLLLWGADINAKNFQGDNALIFAISHNDYDTFMDLRQRGVDLSDTKILELIHEKDSQGTPKHPRISEEMRRFQGSR